MRKKDASNTPYGAEIPTFLHFYTYLYYSLYVRCILSWGRALGLLGGLSTRQLNCCLPRMEERREEREDLMTYTIQYDSVYLACSKKLTDSHLSRPHERNKNVKTKNKLMSMGI